MKKNKLYIANRWNQPAFMPERNLFPDGGSTNPFGVSFNAPTVSTPKIDWSNPVQRNMALGQIKGLTSSFGSGNPINLQQSNQMLSKTIGKTGSSSGGGGLFGKGGAGWGMAGAAAATIIGQIFSAFLVIGFLRKCRTVALHREHLMLRKKYIRRISSLGIAPFSNQVAMMIVQIVMNNSLKYYGSMSVYGESIPIACVGIITKVNMLYMSFIIGISQGLQPIASFNHGAGRHSRVRQAYLQAVGAGALFSLAAFFLFQLAPRQIISLFGDGSDVYFAFAVSYFRIFLFFTFLNFLQPITSNFFTAIGKPRVGAFLSLTRQIIFLLPLLIIFPLFMGIDGIMYAGPVADFLAAAVNTALAIRELRQPQYQSS